MKTKLWLPIVTFLIVLLLIGLAIPKWSRRSFFQNYPTSILYCPSSSIVVLASDEMIAAFPVRKDDSRNAFPVRKEVEEHGILVSLRNASAICHLHMSNAVVVGGPRWHVPGSTERLSNRPKIPMAWLEIRECRSLTLLHRHNSENNYISVLSVSPDGRYLVIAGEKLEIWDTLTWISVASETIPHGSILCVAWPSTSSRFVIGTTDGFVSLIDCPSLRRLASRKLGDAPVECLNCCVSGAAIVAGWRNESKEQELSFLTFVESWGDDTRLFVTDGVRSPAVSLIPTSSGVLEVNLDGVLHSWRKVSPKSFEWRHDQAMQLPIRRVVACAAIAGQNKVLCLEGNTICNIVIE